MVDFNFDIKSIFPERIVKVTSDLLPHTFDGNRYQVAEARSKTCQIIDSLGELSAVSQKLTKPITTHQKLSKFNDQAVYLLGDPQIKPHGVAIGLLKVGKKELYVFDECGQLRKVQSPCILDFYIHESYQRSGLGKVLFDAMLNGERWEPVKCSIDRPSDKMINFMRKHYGLDRIIPQSNNFVLFEGYFGDSRLKTEVGGGGGIASSPGVAVMNQNKQNMPQLCGMQQYVATTQMPMHFTSSGYQSQVPQMATVARYEKPKRDCYSMAEIIQQFGSLDK